MYINHISKRIVLFLGSLHLTLMSALGIWLWCSPGTFSTSPPCAIESASTAILGSHIPIRSEALRAVSLLIYSAFLTPGLNLIVPMGMFLAIHIVYQKWYRNNFRGDTQSRWTVFPVIACMVTLLVINLIFIVDIELSLHRNRKLVGSDESEWTFGQTLALLLLVLPIRDLMETILQHRLERPKKWLLEQEERQIRRKTELLQEAIRSQKIDDVKDLIKDGADVNIEAKGMVIVHCVQHSC
jgi:hypothetical protein